MEVNIDSLATAKAHFAKCNHAKCNNIFLIPSGTVPGPYGLLCPECMARTLTSHVVQCSGCKTVINFVHALEKEEKFCFVIDKCSHCIGSEEDEYRVEPLYTADSYI